MPDLNDFYAFKSTSNGSGGIGSGKQGMGCGWVIIIIVAFMLIYFLAKGADWDAIECLLAWGLIAFFVVRFITR